MSDSQSLADGALAGEGRGPFAAIPVAERAALLSRGVARHLSELGYASLSEFTLRSGRRADLFALNDKGEILIVEIKSGLEDFRADSKWPEYQEFCDVFYFAVAEDFPREVLPETCGLMIADGYGAVILREAARDPLNGSRRRSLLLRFALGAAQRLDRLIDPR